MPEVGIDRLSGQLVEDKVSLEAISARERGLVDVAVTLKLLIDSASAWTLERPTLVAFSATFSRSRATASSRGIGAGSLIQLCSPSSASSRQARLTRTPGRSSRAFTPDHAASTAYGRHGTCSTLSREAGHE